jgi:hypothetical protein
MKKIADFLASVALVCIALLVQVAPAQSQELRNSVVKQTGSLPNKCTAPATPSMSETSTVARADYAYLHSYPETSLASLNLGTTKPTIYNLLQVPNPIDDTRTFVKQHYRDFLVREPPDPSGWDFWSNQITACGSNAECIDNKRVDVSRAFFFDDNFVAYQFPINPDLSQPRGTSAYNSAFVRQCYLTYLRREPNAPPDNNFGGFNFWLGVLNGYGFPTPDAGYNHLIRAFLLSTEYRNRFVSPPC